MKNKAEIIDELLDDIYSCYSGAEHVDMYSHVNYAVTKAQECMIPDIWDTFAGTYIDAVTPHTKNGCLCIWRIKPHWNDKTWRWEAAGTEDYAQPLIVKNIFNIDFLDKSILYKPEVSK